MLPNIHIFGIQGSGKDTQAALLASRFGLTHLSSGALLRKRSEIGDETSAEITAYLEKGQLVPLELLYLVIDQALEALTDTKGIVAAGITRTLEELEGLKVHWNSHGLDSPFGVLLDVSESVAFERAKLRHRADDTDEVLEARFALYHTETEPVLDTLKAAGRLITIDGEQSIEAVQVELLKAVEPYLRDHGIN
jgi:adenylate kinase